MHSARLEEELRDALVAFEAACAVLLVALREGQEAELDRRLADAHARLKLAQERLEAFRRERKRETRD